MRCMWSSLVWMTVALLATGCGDSFREAPAGSGGGAGASGGGAGASGSGGTAGAADASAGTGGGGTGGTSDASSEGTPDDAIATDTTVPDGSDCAPGRKLCGTECVPTDPAHGCEQVSCDPCAGEHQTATCSTSGTCVRSCTAGWGDCDGIAGNGCETDINADAAHCGRCAHDCLGGGCSSGMCEPVAVSNTAAANASGGNLALSATNVYFTVGSGGTSGRVYTVPKGGGNPSPMVSSLGSPRGIALDAQFAYWVDTATNEVRRVNLATFASNFVAGGTNVGSPIALGATAVFWAEGATHRIMATKFDGTSLNSYLAGSKITSLAHAAGQVYFTTATEVGRWSPEAGSAQPMADSQGQATSVKVGQAHVYWSDSSQNEIRRVPIAGGPPQPVTQGKAIAIALDATDVYWANNAGGTIHRAPQSGGPSILIASGQSHPFDIAVDADAVYWIEETGGRVLKVAK